MRKAVRQLILLTPMLAGAAMALPSAFVVANSPRLRTLRPQKGY